MRDQFDREDQDRQVPHWAHEVLDVADDTLLFNALVVVVDENENTEGESGVEVISGWQEAWNQTDQVVDEDEREQQNDDRVVTLGLFFTHDVAGEVVNKLADRFNDVAESDATIWDRDVFNVRALRAIEHAHQQEQHAHRKERQNVLSNMQLVLELAEEAKTTRKSDGRK